MAEPQTSMRPVPLSQTKHKGLKVKTTDNIDHFGSSHFCRVTVSEFADAGLQSPVIFLKNPAGKFFAAAMWGFEPGENLFVEDGKWVGSYMPAIVRGYPFAVLPDPDKTEHFYIGLFEDSPYINADEGDLIIGDDGEPTEQMKQAQEFLTQIYQQDQLTNAFLDKLESLGLIIEQTLQMTNPETGEQKGTDGVFVIDREKLEKLSDEDFLALGRDGSLGAIFAHLMSLQGLKHLVQRRTTRQQAQT